MTVSFGLVTIIRATPQRVFEASLNVDSHVASMEASGETAIAGVTSGTMGLGDTVTWRAKHFGITWNMTSEITELHSPDRFVDEQVRGPFKRFRHEHIFNSHPEGTRMVDRIQFDAPIGVVGDVVERMILGSYLPKLIQERNEFLKSELDDT